MKQKLLILLTIISIMPSESIFSQQFEKYFTTSTMRVDYFHTGTKGQETISLDKVYEESEWSGSKTNLVDNLNFGEYLGKVFDVETNQLILSRGFSSIFFEWSTTDEAVNGVWRTFHESVRLPFPKNKIQLTISRRDKFVGNGEMMSFREIFSCVIDPNNSNEINREKRNNNFKVLDLLNNGKPENKVDLLILGDGYTKNDLQKFEKDAKHFANEIFKAHPFKEHKNDFNVRAIEVISEESGIDKPGKNIWKNTALGTKYDFFGSARYVLTEENKAMRDIAGSVPYDFITILVNDDRYGGGGIYNLYTTCFTKTDKAGMEWQMDYVYVHEFGHSFGGLADEYYSSQVSYNDFYPKGTEPWEPNVTPNTNRETLKWKNFVEEETPIPTMWEKAEYDSLEKERGKLDRLAPDYYDKRKPLYDREQEILKTSKYVGKVGAFEGAGYVSKGMFRPAIDCRMFTLSVIDFDPVCSAAIEKVIEFYTK
ncbi:MAG: peptidase M64 [Ignavibacteriales bacterium]|nr:peptidase M64 [Ignavibacteriales bacterium]